ncbi:ribosomal protection-like ABC-F family protein [Campylobacter helveticus]|uniref:ribosomal protection-like ABC-F family protein n=1 Tax=Campylobacter helveticus TaxID=28898 RepID=UPI00104B00F0|nr:ABC-F family ATP-binding cassette domain-containing protein [Campylobacter helveticus]QBL11115.1 ABC transporter ATP-binding protein [Campylobacter helveticus]TNH34166.1 ABC-F family ATP-binding cassette domain-containing protein [Campylobacter helveticus]TNH35184.1 ABC-F family ATP-binding cassette domain-containing protein [Campylobacter helveticus]
MALIDIIEANKKFGEKIVLDNVSFSINENEKIAIIGKNGEGKSTLLKALLGTLSLDSGRIVKQNNKSIALLSQNVNFDVNLSVKEAIEKELNEIYEALQNYEKLQNALEKSQDKSLLNEMDSVINFIESKDAWNIDNKIMRYLKEFKLESYQNRNLSTLSGGEIRRVGLCILLLKNPDILLLDEPTNHLDVYMCSFLENLLKNSKMCVVFISHDRYFIDEVAQKCIEIEEGKIRIFKGGYTQYLEKKTELLASLSKSHETLLKQLKNEEEWLRRGVKARLKRNEGRKERLFKMRELAKKNPSEIKKIKLEITRANLNFNQQQSINRKKMLFELKNLSLSFGTKKLFSNFNARILQGERIGIVGRNGSGKSSFLKLLLGEIEAESGEIKKGDLKIGYFDQARNFIDENKSLVEIFCPNGGDRVEVRGKNMHIFGYLKSFLFPKEFLDKSASLLSGGEKNRLALALLFTKEYDVLILDEPTNDLDIATINILEEYLQNFEGAILLVSHDRYFVDKIATKIYAFENGTIEALHIPYMQYLENEQELKEFDELLKLEKKSPNSKEKTSKKLSYKENEILQKHPEKIEQLENEIKELQNALSNPKIYEEFGIQNLYEKLEKSQKSLEKLEDEYFAVLEKSEREA